MSQGLRLALIGAALLLVLVAALLLVREILLPFLVGMAAAYLLDPVADRLERLGLSRTLATTVITIAFFLSLVAFLFLLLPPLAAQAGELARDLPLYLEQLRARLVPLLLDLDLPLDLSARGLLERYAGQAIEVVAAAIAGLLVSGVALLNLIALIFVTPVVTFYLLRDWDRMVARVQDNIPRRALPAVVRLAREMDEVLAGFIRGQGLVCLFLALFYGVGLWLVGLRYGLIIGLLTGVFSFIPYIGMALGGAVGLAVAAFQFQSLGPVLLVLGVFALGQFIEGNLISPRLVGARIRLHPVWMIFAALAGAALLGLIGTFIAVPVAAVLGVLLRFALERWRQSPLYDDSPGAGPA